MIDLEKRFAELGTQFVVPATSIKERLSQVDILLFDWDGVFNNGIKGRGATSHFTEADSMGVNMLRFSLWLRSGKLPYCAIITGRQNDSALHFAKRESFHAVCMGYTHKLDALEALKIDASNAAFFFDDILDLSVAAQSKLRIMIGRKQSPLMKDYTISKQWCDLITGSTGGEHAMREACELLIGLNGNWDSVLSARVAFDENYQAYLAARNNIQPEVHEKSR